MRVPSNLRRGGVGFNMTPMIDIVFLLIIFFLVSSHLAKQELQMELDLPTAASGHLPEEDDARRVVVNVLPSGQVMLAGRVVEVEELQRLLQRRRQEGAELEVRIRSDRQVPYRLVEPIMIACAKAGIWNVKFAVTRQ